MKNFLFHRVHPTRDPLWDPMDPALFEKCIKWISNRYEIVLLEDYIEQQNFDNHKNIATILFDDGYLDNYDFAAPILNKYNVKASFYVVTDCIDNNIPTWTHILEHYFQMTSILHLELPFEHIPKAWNSIHFDSSAERIEFAKQLKPFLKKLKHDERERILNHICLQWNDVTLPKLMMNWEQVRALRDAGHYIGSHTVTHAMLGTMDNQEDVKKELLDSANRIQQELGYFPRSISYPVGSYNDQTIDWAKAVGYTCGLAVHQDAYVPNEQNLFEIKRIELYNEPWWKTKLRISNRLETIKKLIRYR